MIMDDFVKELMLMIVACWRILVTEVYREIMTAKREVDSRWKERPMTPIYIHHCKRFSSDEFILVPKARQNHCLQDTSIFIFNATNKGFKKLCDINYSNHTIYTHRGRRCHGPDYISCDIKDGQNGKKIYICSLQYCKFIKLLLNGNQTKIEDPLDCVTNKELNIFRSKAAYILIGNILHIIGGQDYNNHLTFDTFWGEIIEKSRFEHNFLQDSTALHVKSKNCILLIGGDSGDYYKSKGVKQRRWSGIKRYDLTKETWSDVRVSPAFNYSSVRAVLTSNERHIIVTPYESKGKVMVIDIDNDDEFKLKETNIPLPHQVIHDIVRLGDDSAPLIVFGYMRQNWSSFDCRDGFESLDIFPLYLVEIVERYFNLEQLHWVARGSACHNKSTNHYSIAMNKILTGFDKDK